MEDSIIMTTERTNKYSLAGWLAIVSAALIVPQIAFAVLNEILALGWELYMAPLTIFNAAAGVYILYMFRRLLHERYDFRRTDQMITILIWVNVLFAAVGLGDMYYKVFGMTVELAWAILSMALFVIYSIVTIVFGIVLLKLQGDLFDLLKPFAYATIAAGVFGATVILAPVGMLLGIVALVIQGMIFLRAKDEVEYL